MSEQKSAASIDAGIDWSRARRTLRHHLTHRLSGVPPAEIEDLVQESLIGLLRATRRTTVRDLEAFMFTIAHRTAIDYLRRKRRWRLIFEDDPIGSRAASVPAAGWVYGDLEQRIRFLVLQFFSDRSSPCLELARGYFDERDWALVARANGSSHDGIRKQWSRCLTVLRQFISRDRQLARLADCIKE